MQRPWTSTFLLTFLVACPASEPTSKDKVDSGDLEAPDGPPCDCDDGLYCNGPETCDADGTCVPGEAPTAPDDGDPCTVPTTCDEDADAWTTVWNDADPRCVPLTNAPTIGTGDYGYLYWPGNHRPVETAPRVETELHLRTGYYGLAFDEASGALTHFGSFDAAWTAGEARQRPNDDVMALPAVDLRFEAGPSDAPIVATQFQGFEGNPTDRARIIDAGRFMNRVEIPEVAYAGAPGLEGRVEIAAMPRHVVFNHTVASGGVARIRWGGNLDASARVTWETPDRAVELTDATGSGWLFVVHDTDGGTTRLTYDAVEGLVAERTLDDGTSGPATISLLAVPTRTLGPAERALYLDPEGTARVTYTLLDVDGNNVDFTRPVAWDPTLGAFKVPLGTLQDAGAGRKDFENPVNHTWYGRHAVSVDTGGQEMSVPLALFGSDRVSWYVTGGVPLFRDEVDGTPLGVPVQISKDWHGESWYHFYAQPTFPGTDTAHLEFTIASSKWGPTYAASHAQLSLVGYRDHGGHWDEAALGCFGESVTYDPDVTLNRSMIDDVRPFLVDAQGRWNWTGNVGGADFLRYVTTGEPTWQRRLARVRSTYDAVGPVLTDVTYSGVTTDGRIEADLRTRLGGTNDLVRLVYDLEYRFLEDVSYDRLAFFQIAADGYADNGFTRAAYGNADGVLADLAVPDHRTTGYAAESDRGIALSGPSPWVMLYDNRRERDSLPERYADVGFVVRDFEANLGGTVLTTPHVNVHRTNNGQSQLAFELGLPYAEGAAWCGAPCGGQRAFVPAGSTVHATIEYLVPPADKSRYYGDDDTLLALPAEAYRTTEMMLTLARGNALTLTMLTGTAVGVQPPVIEVAEGTLAAEFELTGGLGYVPVTFRGLVRHDGWVLERAVSGGGDAEGTPTESSWVTVDQTVWGGDDRQVDYVADAGTYDMVVPLANRGTQRYRLRWEAPTR